MKILVKKNILLKEDKSLQRKRGIFGEWTTQFPEFYDERQVIKSGSILEFTDYHKGCLNFRVNGFTCAEFSSSELNNLIKIDAIEII